MKVKSKIKAGGATYAPGVQCGKDYPQYGQCKQCCRDRWGNDTAARNTCTAYCDHFK